MKIIVFLILNIFFISNLFAQEPEPKIQKEKITLKVKIYLTNEKLNQDKFFKSLSLRDISTKNPADKMFFYWKDNAVIKGYYRKENYLQLDIKKKGLLKVMKPGYIPEYIKITDLTQDQEYQIVMKKWYPEYLTYLNDQNIIKTQKDNYYLQYIKNRFLSEKRNKLNYIDNNCIQDQFLILNIKGGVGKLKYVIIKSGTKKIDIKDGSYLAGWKYMDMSFSLNKEEDLKHYFLVGIFSNLELINIQSKFVNSLKLGYGLLVSHQTAFNLFGTVSSSGPIFSSGYFGLGMNVKNKLYAPLDNNIYLGLNIGYQYTKMKYNHEYNDDYDDIVSYHIHNLFGELVFKLYNENIDTERLISMFSIHLGFNYQIYRFDKILDPEYSFSTGNRDFNNWMVYLYINLPCILKF